VSSGQTCAEGSAAKTWGKSGFWACTNILQVTKNSAQKISEEKSYETSIGIEFTRTSMIIMDVPYGHKKSIINI